MAILRKHAKSRSFDLLSAYNWFVPTWGDFVILVVLGIVGAMIGSGVLLGLMALVSREFALSYGIAIFYPLQFLPAMLYASAKSSSSRGFIKGYTLDNNNFAPLGGWVAALSAVALMIGCAFIIEPLGELLPDMDEKTKLMMEMLSKGPLWVSLLSTAVFAPFFEEWLLRGVVLRGLLRKMKPVWAILLSSVVFGLIHGNIWQAIPATLMGCALGWVYYKTGSLKLTMLMHCINNASSVCLSRIFPDSDAYKSMFGMMKEGGNLTSYALIYCTAVLLAAAGIYAFMKIKTATPQGSCQEITEEDSFLA